MLFGIILGPVAAKFIDSERWGTAKEGQTEYITLVSSMSIENLLSKTGCPVVSILMCRIRVSHEWSSESS
jgi:hypothetical protein